MATHPRSAIHNKLFSILNGDATLKVLIKGVYDNAPDNAELPFIEFGDMDLGDFGSHTTSGVDGDITIHGWAESRGRQTMIEIMARVYALLHDIDLALTGFPTITFRANLDQIQVENDNRTYHGIQRYDIILGGN